MEARTARVVFTISESQWVNFNWDGVIFPKSVVHASVSEVSMVFGGLGGDSSDVAQRHRGNAIVGVRNVRPHGPNAGDHISGGVEIYLTMDNHRGAIKVAVDITVMSLPETTVLP